MWGSAAFTGCDLQARLMLTGLEEEGTLKSPLVIVTLQDLDTFSGFPGLLA